MCGAKQRESEEWEEVGKCSIRIKTIIKKKNQTYSVVLIVTIKWFNSVKLHCRVQADQPY